MTYLQVISDSGITSHPVLLPLVGQSVSPNRRVPLLEKRVVEAAGFVFIAAVVTCVGVLPRISFVTSEVYTRCLACCFAY